MNKKSRDSLWTPCAIVWAMEDECTYQGPRRIAEQILRQYPPFRALQSIATVYTSRRSLEALPAVNKPNMVSTAGEMESKHMVSRSAAMLVCGTPGPIKVGFPRNGEDPVSREYAGSVALSLHC